MTESRRIFKQIIAQNDARPNNQPAPQSSYGSSTHGHNYLETPGPHRAVASVFFSHPDVNFLLPIFFKWKFSSLGPKYS